MILTGPETWSCHNSLRSPLRVMKKTVALLFCVVTPILAQEGTPPKLGPVEVLISNAHFLHLQLHQNPALLMIHVVPFLMKNLLVE